MKKKILLIIMSVLCIVLAGCGSDKPDIESEAFKFNSVYQGEGLEKLEKAFRVASEEIVEKYGKTPEASNEMAKLDAHQKLLDFKAKMLAAKTENEELRPLKDLLAKHVDAAIAYWDAVAVHDIANIEKLERSKLQTKFDYFDKWYMLIFKCHQPVLNSSVGQIYANRYGPGPVLFGVVSIEESYRMGGKVFYDEAKGKFVTVKIAAFNSQKVPITLSNKGFSLLGKGGAKYQPLNLSLRRWTIERLFSKYDHEDIEPNTDMEVKVVFDVPKEVEISEHWMEIFWDGSYGKVVIPMTAERTGY